jgi:hypothetical protein
MSDVPEGNRNIQVEITDPSEFHCFRLILNPQSAPGERIEIMLHARSLVDLIHKCSLALCDWQAQNTQYLIDRLSSYAEGKADPL